MEYEYLPIELARPGDIVQYVGDPDISFTVNKLYIVREDFNPDDYSGKGMITVTEDDEGIQNGWSGDRFKLVTTKPGSEAKVGDIIVRTPIQSAYEYRDQHILGKVETVENVKDDNVKVIGTYITLNTQDFKVLCKANGNVTSPKEEPKTIVIPTPKGTFMEAQVFDHSIWVKQRNSGALLGQSKFNQTTKEETMSKDIEIKINGEVVCSGKKAAKKKTGLEIQKKNHKIYAVYFNEAGNAVEEGFYKTEAEATQRLASAALIGCTVVTYKQSKSVRQKLQLEEA